jgi:hypothetical protein
MLQPFVGRGLLHGGFVTVHFSRVGFRATHPTPNLEGYTLPGPYPLTCLVWFPLPGAFTPTSIAFQVIGSCKPPLPNKAVVLVEALK